MSDLPFSLQKALHKGTATPCVARTLPQTGGLLNAFTSDEKLKHEVLLISYEVMEHQLACLEVVESVVPQITAGIKQVNAGLDLQAEGRVVSLPSVPNIKMLVGQFLHSAKLSLRDTGRLFDAFHGQAFDHRFDKARRWAESEFGTDSLLVQVLDGYARWIKRVITWRNAVEHPRDARGRLHVDDFRLVNIDQNGQQLIAVPALYQGTEKPVPLRECLTVTQDNLLTFYEDVLSSLLLLSPNPFGLTIRDIPKSERNPENPIRLVPDLSGAPCSGRGSESPKSSIQGSTD